MFQFLVGTDRREIVVRRNQRKRIAFANSGLDYELVSADTIGEFEILGCTIPPGGVMGTVRHVAQQRGVCDRDLGSRRSRRSPGGRTSSTPATASRSTASCRTNSSTPAAARLRS